MDRYTPTPEMIEFAREAFRVNALNRAGLSTEDDIDQLEQLGRQAQIAQRAANARRDQG